MCAIAVDADSVDPDAAFGRRCGGWDDRDERSTVADRAEDGCAEDGRVEQAVYSVGYGRAQLTGRVVAARYKGCAEPGKETLVLFGAERYGLDASVAGQFHGVSANRAACPRDREGLSLGKIEPIQRGEGGQGVDWQGGRRDGVDASRGRSECCGVENDKLRLGTHVGDQPVGHPDDRVAGSKPVDPGTDRIHGASDVPPEDVVRAAGQ